MQQGGDKDGLRDPSPWGRYLESSQQANAFRLDLKYLQIKEWSKSAVFAKVANSPETLPCGSHTRVVKAKL